MDTAKFHPGEYLTFRLAGQEFAIEAARVIGIVPLHDMAAVEPLEGSPPLLLGHAAVVGRPFQVLDLADWLGLARQARQRDAYIVVIESDAAEGCRTLGFPVDRVCGVIPARKRDYARGKLRIGRPRSVLAADRLFSTP